MNTRSLPRLVSLLSVTLTLPLAAKDNPSKVSAPQKPQVQSMKKAPTAAPQVKPEAKKAPKKVAVPSKSHLDLKKIAPKKIKPDVKPSMTKPTKLKPKTLKPSVKKPSASKPSSVKSPSSKRPPTPKTTSLPSKPNKNSLPTKQSVGNILGKKDSAKPGGLIPSKVPGKKTASIPAPKKVDPQSKSKVPGAMKKSSLAAKESALPKTQNLPGKTLKTEATAGSATSLTVQPSTDLQINREDIGQSAENLTENLGQRESLGERAGIDVAGKTNLGERSGLGSLSGKGGKGVKENLAAQMGLAPGKLAGLGGKGDVVDSEFFGEGTARWNENSNGKLNRGDGQNYAEIVYTHHDSTTGQDWTITVSLQNPGLGATENDDVSVFADTEEGIIVVSVIKSVKNFRKRGEVTGYADTVADQFAIEVTNQMGQDEGASDPGNNQQENQAESETETDTFRWAWEDDTDDQEASQSGDGDTMQWAWADDSTSDDSSQGEQDSGGESDEFHWAWEDDSSSDDASTDGTASADDSSTEDTASADPTPDPDSGSDQRTADGDTPDGNASGQEDENKVAAALSRGGRGTIRTGEDAPRGGVSQTKTGSSTDNDTVRVDPDNVRGAEDSAKLRARIAQESNPEEGQSGQEGGRGGIDLPSPLGGLTGGPVANPSGGGGDPSTLRKGASGGTLLEAIRQQDVQINADSLKNVQQIKQ